MKRTTTTKKIIQAFSITQIVKAECYNKDTHQITAIDNDTFNENLQFMNESGRFIDCIGWTYEKNHTSDREVIIETGRHNAECDCIITAFLRVNDGVSMDDLENMLKKIEED